MACSIVISASSLLSINGESQYIWMSMEVIVTIVSKLVYFIYLRHLQPTYIGVKSPRY